MQIKSYFGYHEEHKGLYRTLFTMTQPVGEVYDNYADWFKRVFVPGLKKGERGYIVAKEEKGKVVGCALLKDTPNEKKICTLFVRSDWRGRGVGTELMKSCLKALGPKPLLTVSHKNFPQFKPLLQRFGFELSSKRRVKDRIEYCFNDQRAEVIERGLIPVLIQRIRQLRHK
ncbi:MAG: GNAT family N-acetyltransferase [Alphaproteobacteria bacterium]|nr:GNAT family N-acetyltransferase [Alphaproteobacteria bacterium]